MLGRHCEQKETVFMELTHTPLAFWLCHDTGMIETRKLYGSGLFAGVLDFKCWLGCLGRGFFNTKAIARNIKRFKPPL